ncbi:DNA endonuclease RBBP8 [Madurella mycetomatis]|uniref:DNA endonuclease RBBP8 n=1 Tax=Madurella mycetomatis TaxID=100816 RepID=A0A175VXF9_9PEZI|nr:DNA endonuclease RBBP8 [Madurella mycetomatis]
MPDQLVYTRNDYSIDWACAFDKEQTAAIAVLDGDGHSPLPKPTTDANAYTLGSRKTENSSFVAVTALMVPTFPAIKISLMVDIAGGVDPKCVVQWDFGKSVKGGGF